MGREHQELVLGIDLGGTKILSAVVDFQGNILARDYSITPAAKGQDAVLEAIGISAERALEQAGMEPSLMMGVGIGAPGPSNPNKGILFTSPNLPGWKDVPIASIMGDLFHRETFLINDANAAALAEHRFGSGLGARHMIYLTVSTGIGGGVIMDGQLYTGAIGTAAELGHMTINDTGPRCNCGNFGCWEAMASGTALARAARERLQQRKESQIMELVGGDLEKVTAQTVQRAAEQGDALARELIAGAGYYLGVGLANLINLFNPEVIVIGGGVSNMGSLLLGPALETAGRRAYKVAYEAVRFAEPKLGRDSGVLGAAAHVFDCLEKEGHSKS